MKRLISKAVSQPFIYWLLLSVVFIIFLLLAFTSAHQLPSRVDEGSFLIKGYYYVTGRYKPFQDYGPWTNNMPLAYYIPGLAQVIFGTGLRTGRYFAIFLTVLNFAGIWILINRLKGKWWALLSVLVLSINPAVVGIYVQAISEGVVACALTWALVFLIGEKRTLWQIALGAFFCALTTLIRQNMVILLPFALVYAFWLHGKKAGWIALAFTAIPFILVHLIFFPQIMALWFSWLPEFFKQIFHIVIVAGGGKPVWAPSADLLDRISSFFMAFRYQFVMLLGVFVAAIMLPIKNWWDDDHEQRTVLLLTILFAIFFGLHGWASLSKNYCVFCFPNYLAFFLPIGMLISIVAFSNLVEKRPHISVLLVVIFILIIFPGLFISSLETVGRWVMELPFPRVKDGQVLSGSVPVWNVFANRYSLSYDQLLPVIPPIIGTLLAVMFILITLLIHRLFRLHSRFEFGTNLVINLLIFGILLTPTLILGKDPDENTCGGDVLTSFENAGAQLEKVIPDRAKVYWSAGSVVTPLLYITGADIHPPQLNGIYSARRGGDRNLLEKDGYYNEASRQAWKDSDQFFLISYTSMGDNWKEFLNPKVFSEFKPTTPLDPCDPLSLIRIYRRD